MQNITLISLGGTISSVENKQTGKLESGKLTGNELIKDIDLENFDLNLKIVDLKAIPSTEMKLSDIVDIKKQIDSEVEEGADAIVLTHGTDTLEETAFMLDLLYNGKAPVVITGSQRSMGNLGYDGSANLRDAIIVSSSDLSRNKGVLVVFDEKIFLARYVSKINSTELGGFSSTVSGPIGNVYGREVFYYYDTIEYKKLEILDYNFEKSVYIVKMNLDFDENIFDKIIDKDCHGIIIEGFGVGSVTPAVQDKVEKAIKLGIPVVLVTKCIQGGVRCVYGTKGTAVKLKELGAILDYGYLSSNKARLKLIAMQNSAEKDKIKNKWNLY